MAYSSTFTLEIKVGRENGHPKEKWRPQDQKFLLDPSYRKERVHSILEVSGLENKLIYCWIILL